ncbi:hypothetical protein [Stackebrandtia nassauensis]|uniref:Uncharacterized protein n=1 Tax=Stackebrandtia nassauensis (strain DSM 44728 / CIP 108903 / NRRL B-16338 / NBRC 102104 / LLR-40K-21) TaxID=446470 RepID=D3Q4H1_STANL|nr:hypothetical protein [Stackebrandtia nassauensis]ADD40131.1 hypothetical protein Snas_0414 [Stackebrandtia nassauensis DSM 44728]
MSAEVASTPLWIPVLLGGTLLLSLAAVVAVILLSVRVNKLSAELRARHPVQPMRPAPPPHGYGQQPQSPQPGQQPPLPPGQNPQQPPPPA